MTDFYIEKMTVKPNLNDKSNNGSQELCRYLFEYKLVRTTSEIGESYEWFVPAFDDNKPSATTSNGEVCLSTKRGDGSRAGYWIILITKDDILNGKVTISFEIFAPTRQKRLMSIPGVINIYQYLFRIGSESESSKSLFMPIYPKKGWCRCHAINAAPIDADNPIEFSLNNLDPHSISFVSITHFESSILRSSKRFWASVCSPILLSVIASVLYGLNSGG